MSLVSDESRQTNQLASDWMHRGIDLLNENSAATLEQAVRCFDEAIALRRTLPLEGNHFFRYGLSAGWINRGDALARREGQSFLTQAVQSYDEALALLRSLPLEENTLYPRRLAITWINRGTALQKQEPSHDQREARACFREAVEVLEHFSAAPMADRTSLLAGAWVNLAGTLTGPAPEDAEDVRSAAHKALGLVKSFEQADKVSAEIGLKARHLLCRLAVKDLGAKKSLSQAVTTEATDAVDEALALVRHWKFSGQIEMRKLALEVFRFGCRLYENNRPRFLAEFLIECLAPELFGETIPPDRETLDAAQAAIWSALDKLQPDGFQFVATSRFEPFLADIRKLGKAEERLKQLHLPPTPS